MPSPWPVVFSVLATLIATAILTHLRKRRLYVVVSSLFPYSSLTDRGTIVQLSVVNRGTATEENVEITLDAQLTYELVASTASNVTLEKNTLQMPRLPANDQLQFVLMADGGTFSPSSIQSVTSRQTKGKTIEGLEKLPASAGATFAATGMLVGLLVLGVAGGYFAGVNATERKGWREAGQKDGMSPEEAAKVTELESQGWRGVEGFLKSGLAAAYPDRLPVSVGEVTRRRDIVEVVLTFRNQTDDILRFSGDLISPAGERDEVSASDRWVSDVVLTPHAEQEKTLKAYLPAKFPEQMLIAEFRVFAGSDIVHLEKRIRVAD